MMESWNHLSQKLQKGFNPAYTLIWASSLQKCETFQLFQAIQFMALFKAAIGN